MIQSGILLIDKPEGPSSAQVLHRVKIILGAKKLGHLGTLDPFASGLLLLSCGEAVPAPLAAGSANSSSSVASDEHAAVATKTTTRARVFFMGSNR